jgi:PII-like signaling protein
MHGFQLTFFTQQNREHDGTPLAEWLVVEAKRIGIRGATVLTATQGFGHDGRFHSAEFFDLSDQPLQVVLAVSDEEAQRLFARLKAENIRVFYTKAPIEFGMLGEE